MMQEGNHAGRVAKSAVNAARHDPQGWSTACELIRVGAGEVVFDSRYQQLDLALSRTRALLKAACFMHDYPDQIDSYELMSMVEVARDTLLSLGDDPLEFMEDFANGARQVVYPPRQNSCRLSMMLNLGATRMRDGSVRRSIQEQSGGAVVAAGERPSGRGITRDWGFGADIGTMA
jgi:hypothetical protein